MVAEPRGPVMGLWLPLSPAVLLVAVLVYALAEGSSLSEFLRICGVGLMAGGAAWLLGALVGFLFGLPRITGLGDSTSRQLTTQTPEGTSTAAVQTTASPEGFLAPALMRTNTNLEEISDWLTKILVGLGLVQLGAFTTRLDDSGAALAEGLGNGTGAKPFALGLLIYGLIDGFLFGYLWTRTVASLKLKRAEEELNRRLLRENMMSVMTNSVLQSPPPPAPPVEMPPPPPPAAGQQG
jgi:hypothetical protein